MRARAIISERWPELFVSISSEVAPRIDEYPRTAATNLNSYIGPLMADYVQRIETGSRERGYEGQVFFATSGGGLVDGRTVAKLPIMTAQSGPASGVIACAAAGRLRQDVNILAADMGGTSLVSVSLRRDRSFFETKAHRASSTTPETGRHRLDRRRGGGGVLPGSIRIPDFRVGPRAPDRRLDRSATGAAGPRLRSRMPILFLAL